MVDSPTGGYKPDSTISDTELERQQQQFIHGDYYSPANWNAQSGMMIGSPRRPNLDDRIDRMLSDSPTNMMTSGYSTDGYSSYPATLHDNHHPDLFYQDIYSHNQHNSSSSSSSFMPPPSHLHMPPQIMMNHSSYEDSNNFNAFQSPRNFVNNSNLVEITQQKRDRQRAGNQVAVQVGNVLEIVPSNKIPTPPQEHSSTNNVAIVESSVSGIKSKQLTPSEIKKQNEKKEHLKLRRKADRERKRMAKFVRKEKLRLEIQKYFDAGITIDDPEEERKLPAIPTPEIEKNRSIIKNKKSVEKDKSTLSFKKVLFSDGIQPGETSSDNELHDDDRTKKIRIKRRHQRKRKLALMIRERKKALASEENDNNKNNKNNNGNSIEDELETSKQDVQPHIELPVPSPPNGSPPPHLLQPKLKKITNEMFAVFAVNPEPIYYHVRKIQEMSAQNNAVNNHHHHHHQHQLTHANQYSSRGSDRYYGNRYHKNAPPQYQSNYSHYSHSQSQPSPRNSASFKTSNIRE
jgi:hypothetical protein